MNPIETLRGLARRWYITVPGLILAVAVGLGVWTIVPPAYERSATQLLLPGAESMPVDSNPLLFLGGLSYATDVVVRAVGADNVLNEIEREYPDADVTVERDGSGPFVVVTVAASTSEEAGEILDIMIARTESVLAEIQESEAIVAENRISVVPITVDAEGVVQQRDRAVAAGAAALATAALALLLAGLVDGMGRQKRKPTRDDDAAEQDGAEESDSGATDPPADPEDEFRDMDFPDTSPVTVPPGKRTAVGKRAHNREAARERLSGAGDANTRRP